MKKSVSMLCHTELPLRHPEFISGSISYMQKKRDAESSSA